jgi:hypothetical protein
MLFGLFPLSPIFTPSQILPFPSFSFLTQRIIPDNNPQILTKMKTTYRTCKVCDTPFRGRSDKIYCSVACKNVYHVDLRKKTAKVIRQTDTILHRNRSILFEVIGDNAVQRKVPRRLLDKMKFNFNYITGYYLNSKGKTYHYVYDFSWMIFSDQEVLIVRRKNEQQQEE